MTSTPIGLPRWTVRKHESGLWRVYNSLGDWDSDYPDWSPAVQWASSPYRRLQYYANEPNAI
jgi:hypothetical protein